MKTRILSLALALCLIISVVFTLASCGKDDAPETTAAITDPATDPAATDPGAEEVTTVEETTDKWEVLAPKITMLSAKDRSLRIECSCKQTAVKGSKNDIYLKGPDEVIDGETPLIQVMVYERNKAANDLLGTSTSFVFWDLDFNEQAPQIDLVVKGNSSDAPDLFVNMLNDLNHEMLNGTFKDVWSIPNSFFDFTTDGWLWEWMQNLSLSNDRGYILGSNYFIDVFRAMSVMPFNMTMMDANAAKLAPAILDDGDSLGEGETLTPRFFDLVEMGNWTWDVLGKLCEAIWVDQDGNEQDSIYDQLGLLTDTYGGDAAAAFVYTSGVTVTTAYIIKDESSDYLNDQWIKYADDASGLGLIFDAAQSVFLGAGSLTTAKDRPANTPENPGLAYHYTKFAASEVLFIGSLLLAALENDTIQQMNDLFSVVPCPKVDANLQRYNTIIYNSGDVGAINVNIGPRRARALTAYLQYCTENSAEIIDQFLEIVMKYKVTTYNQGTDRMLSLIYDSILWGRDYTVEGINMDPRWHGLMRKNQFTVGSGFIEQQYESYRGLKQNLLDSVMRKWYTLPKVEN